MKSFVLDPRFISPFGGVESAVPHFGGKMLRAVDLKSQVVESNQVAHIKQIRSFSPSKSKHTLSLTQPPSFFFKIQW